MFRRKLRFFLHRWHRRLGLTAALVIVLVSITGVMLNHTGGLSLAKLYPQSAFWLWPYPTDANTGILLKDHVIYQTSQSVYVNQNVLLSCKPPLITAASIDSQLWILCQNSLNYLEDNHLIESIETVLLGEGINSLAISPNEELLLRNHKQWFGFDSLSMALTEPTAAPTHILKPEILDAQFQSNHSISWQKVILDLHSGRFFGPWGVYIVDGAAVILLLLSLSGFWIWFSRQR